MLSEAISPVFRIIVGRLQITILLRVLDGGGCYKGCENLGDLLSLRFGFMDVFLPRRPEGTKVHEEFFFPLRKPCALSSLRWFYGCFFATKARRH